MSKDQIYWNLIGCKNSKKNEAYFQGVGGIEEEM